MRRGSQARRGVHQPRTLVDDPLAHAATNSLFIYSSSHTRTVTASLAHEIKNKHDPCNAMGRIAAQMPS